MVPKNVSASTMYHNVQFTIFDLKIAFFLTHLGKKRCCDSRYHLHSTNTALYCEADLGKKNAENCSTHHVYCICSTRQYNTMYGPMCSAVKWPEQESLIPHICTLRDSRRRLVSGVNHSLAALLHVPSARWAPNRSGSVKDGEAAHSPLHNTAQGNQ